MSARDAIVMLDGEGLITFWNQAAEKMFGYEAAEVLGKELHRLICPPKYYPAYTKAFPHFQETGQGSVVGKTIQITAVKKDGSEIFVEVSLAAVKLKDTWNAVGTVRDITERKRMELALRESEEKYRLLFENAQVGMWRAKVDGSRILAVNPKLLETLGFRAEEIHKDSPFLRWADPDQQAEMIKELVKQGIVRDFEASFVAKSGEVKTCLLTAVLDQEQGMIEGNLVDISERKRMEEELRRSNAELEQFALLASHDLQEPLRKVIAFGARLKQKFGQKLGEQGLDYLERMQSATSRMQTLITKLLDYSRVRMQGTPFELVDLEQILAEVEADLEELIRETNATLDHHDLPRIVGDPVGLRQLFHNLLSNALKFHRPDAAPRVIVEAEVEEGRCRIQFRDNGIGFDEKYAERIFALFQRLHGRDRYVGSGIGLAICKRIVEHHGGTIIAKSKPGEGATFIVELPLHSGSEHQMS
jgi:two-component system, LuxR family, sensor kinase FixL